MRYIDSLLRRKAACNSTALSRKIKLSRSSTMEYISDMKKLGFPINYSRKDKCFYYDKNGRMTKHLFEQEEEL